MENRTPLQILQAEELAKPDTVGAAISRLHQFALENELYWEISFLECEGFYSVRLSGIGEGESFEIKRALTICEGVNEIIRDARAYYEGRTDDRP